MTKIIMLQVFTAGSIAQFSALYSNLLKNLNSSYRSKLPSMEESNSEIKHQNKLFVTNISEKASRYTVYELLVQVSRIRGFHYDQDRGYCFAEYETPEDLEYTCNVLKGVKLYGKRIYLNKVEERVKVIVKNIGAEIDDVFLWDVFSKFGSCHIEIGGEEGVGIVLYKRIECALKAVEIVNGRTIGNSKVFVEIDKPNKNMGAEY